MLTSDNRLPLLPEEGQLKKSTSSESLTTVAVKPSRPRGWLLAFLAVLAVSPDALLLRYIRESGAQLAVIIFIKYMLMGLVQAVLVFAIKGGIVRSMRALARRGWPYVPLAAGFMLLTQIGFTVSLLETTAANAIMLFSLNPLWAALLGWATLGDSVPRHTAAAMAVAAVAVVVAFLPAALGIDVAASHTAEGASRPTLHGNVCALLTGVTLAAFITASRAGSLRTPGAPMGLAPALGSFGAALCCGLVLPFSQALFGTPLSALFSGLDMRLFIPAIVADAVLEAVYDVWMALASRHITAAEVALVLLLEIPLGPWYVFIGFHEVPSIWTVGGGGLLVATLVAHGIYEASIAASLDASVAASLAASLAASPHASLHAATAFAGVFNSNDRGGPILALLRSASLPPDGRAQYSPPTPPHAPPPSLLDSLLSSRAGSQMGSRSASKVSLSSLKSSLTASPAAVRRVYSLGDDLILGHLPRAASMPSAMAGSPSTPSIRRAGGSLHGAGAVGALLKVAEEAEALKVPEEAAAPRPTRVAVAPGGEEGGGVSGGAATASRLLEEAKALLASWMR